MILNALPSLWVDKDQDQDVLYKYGNILLFKENHYQCLIKSDWEDSKECKIWCEHTKSLAFWKSLKHIDLYSFSNITFN